jgi:hypothetical protein
MMTQADGYTPPDTGPATLLLPATYVDAETVAADAFGGFFFPAMRHVSDNDVQHRLTEHLSLATEPCYDA